MVQPGRLTTRNGAHAAVLLANLVLETTPTQSHLNSIQPNTTFKLALTWWLCTPPPLIPPTMSRTPRLRILCFKSLKPLYKARKNYFQGIPCVLRCLNRQEINPMIPDWDNVQKLSKIGQINMLPYFSSFLAFFQPLEINSSLVHASVQAPWNTSLNYPQGILRRNFFWPVKGFQQF